MSYMYITWHTYSSQIKCISMYISPTNPRFGRQLAEAPRLHACAQVLCFSRKLRPHVRSPNPKRSWSIQVQIQWLQDRKRMLQFCMLGSSGSQPLTPFHPLGINRMVWRPLSIPRRFVDLSQKSEVKIQVSQLCLQSSQEKQVNITKVSRKMNFWATSRGMMSPAVASAKSTTESVLGAPTIFQIFPPHSPIGWRSSQQTATVWV